MLEITNEGILLQNVVPIYRGERIVKFVSSISISDIGKVYGDLVYDEKTQRGFIDKKRKGKIDKVQIKSNKNIEEMREKILEGFFDGGTLSWNVRIKSCDEWSIRERYEFDIMERTLLIKGRVTLPDSAQRHEVLNSLKGYDLSIHTEQYCFPLQISFYTLTEEQNLFAEVNAEGQRASKSRSLYLSNDIKSKTVKKIIENTFLRDNVECKTGRADSTGMVTNFAIIHRSLFERGHGVFRHVKDEGEYEKVAEWMIKFYNQLVLNRPELSKLSVEDRRKCNANSIVTTKGSFEAFAYIAKALIGNPQWKRKLELLNSPYSTGMWKGDIFDLTNPIWHGTVCVQNPKGEWKIVQSRRCNAFIIETLVKHLNLSKFY